MQLRSTRYLVFALLAGSFGLAVIHSCGEEPTDPDKKPACSISETSLAFGTVSVGSWKEMSFTVTNVGGGTLSDSVSEMCDSYTITSGSGQ